MIEASKAGRKEEMNEAREIVRGQAGQGHVAVMRTWALL